MSDDKPKESNLTRGDDYDGIRDLFSNGPSYVPPGPPRGILGGRILGSYMDPIGYGGNPFYPPKTNEEFLMEELRQVKLDRAIAYTQLDAMRLELKAAKEAQGCESCECDECSDMRDVAYAAHEDDSR